MYDYACMTLVCMQLQEFDGDLTEKSCGVLFELIRITQQVYMYIIVCHMWLIMRPVILSMQVLYTCVAMSIELYLCRKLKRSKENFLKCKRKGLAR